VERSARGAVSLFDTLFGNVAVYPPASAPLRRRGAQAGRAKEELDVLPTEPAIFNEPDPKREPEDS